MNPKRQFLKNVTGFTAASNLPKVWVAPIMSTVTLPAHALTSVSAAPRISFGGFSDLVSPLTISISDDSPGFRFQIVLYTFADPISSNNFPPQSNVVNGYYVMPLVTNIEIGNSGTTNQVSRTYDRSLPSDVRYVVNVTDSDGNQTTASARAITP